MAAEVTRFLITPLIGAVIGWITNVIAIRMIFRPRRAFRIPLINYSFQGLLPKRRAEFARSIGKTVGEELLPVEDLVDRLRRSNLNVAICDAIYAYLEQRLEASLPGFLPSNLRSAVSRFLRHAVGREAVSLVESLLERAEERLRNEADIGRMVEEKVLAFDFDRLEKLVISVAARELRHIEVLGAVLGFLIGLGQAAVMALL